MTRALKSLVIAGALICGMPAVASANPQTLGAQGPDVSSWQHIDGTKIDWHSVRKSGHDFAMVKATEGL
ncbi:MAG: glycoside hydrolase, partial [Rhodococcus fascians]